nr:hypothetical protein [Tanacetum cinerariifolium]
METKEVCKCYISPCFVEGLDAYDGINDLKYEKKLISNEVVVKLGLQYELKKNGEKVVNREVLVSLNDKLYFVGFVINPKEDDVEPGVIFRRSFLRLTKAIVNFGSRIITIYPDLITFNSDLDDKLDAILASINVEDLPPLDITDIPPFVYNMGKNLRNKKKASKIYKMSYDDLYKRIMKLNKSRPIIETLKYDDKHKKVIDSVLLDKLKLDGDFELEEMVGKELIRGYRAIREKICLRVFVLQIRLDGKYNYRALVDTGLNMNNFLIRFWSDVVNVKNEHVKINSDDDEDYCLMRDETGKPFNGPNHDKYLNCDDPMDRVLALKDAINPFKKTVGTHDDETCSSRSKRTCVNETMEEAMYLDATTLREFIIHNGRLITEDPAPGVLRVAMT